VLLWLGSVAWVIGYDTLYAIQDIEDDALVGVKSSARALGDKAPLGIAISTRSRCCCGRGDLVGAARLAGAARAGARRAAPRQPGAARRSGRRRAGAELFRSNRTCGCCWVSSRCWSSAFRAR
jgi:4-hydroxybenzoate polyprenyltransferase